MLVIEHSKDAALQATVNGQNVGVHSWMAMIALAAKVRQHQLLGPSFLPCSWRDDSF